MFLGHDVLPVAKVTALGGVLLIVAQAKDPDLVAHALSRQNGVQAAVDVVGALEGSQAQANHLSPKGKVNLHLPVDLEGAHHQNRRVLVVPQGARNVVPRDVVPKEPNLVLRRRLHLEVPGRQTEGGQLAEEPANVREIRVVSQRSFGERR